MKNEKMKENKDLITKNKTILVAEDEEYNFLYLELLLSRMNFNIIHAKNGQEAVDICKSNSNIDLILMDIKMPIMDGHTAAKQIRSFMPNLPIVAQTAYAMEDEKAFFIDDFSYYLTKPIGEKDFKELIIKCFTLNDEKI